jgi:hypothetical protein
MRPWVSRAYAADRAVLQTVQSPRPWVSHMKRVMALQLIS